MTDTDEIHELTVRLGCREIASRLGFHVRGSHSRARGACPLCGTKNTQAFSLTTKDSAVIFHCFACGGAGDFIELVGKLRGLVDFKAQTDAAVELLSMAPIPERTTEQTTNAQPIDGLSYHNVVTALIAVCRKFRPIVDVVHYVGGRGILESARESGLFALPACNRQPRIIDALLEQFELDTLVAAGLVWRMNDGQIRRDVLSYGRNRLCIPWKSPEGRIETLQRRVLDSSNPRYVFPKGIKARHPFGIDKLKAAPKDAPIAFVEGALDCLSLATICRRRELEIIPLALGSVSNWCDGWAQYCKGREVYIALDADKAGDERMPDFAIALDEAGATSIRRWRPEHGKDWNEQLLKAAS